MRETAPLKSREERVRGATNPTGYLSYLRASHWTPLSKAPPPPTSATGWDPRLEHMNEPWDTFNTQATAV